MDSMKTVWSKRGLVLSDDAQTWKEIEAVEEKAKIEQCSPNSIKK
jgi:hypothetical protein